MPYRTAAPDSAAPVLCGPFSRRRWHRAACAFLALLVPSALGVAFVACGSEADVEPEALDRSDAAVADQGGTDGPGRDDAAPVAPVDPFVPERDAGVDARVDATADAGADGGADAANDGSPDDDASPSDASPSDASPSDASPPDASTGDSGGVDGDASASDDGGFAFDASTGDSGGVDADASASDAESPNPGGCIAGVVGTHAARFRWSGSGSGSTAFVQYEANNLPDRSRWRAGAYSRGPIGYRPVWSDVPLGGGGLEMGGDVFIDVELSTANLPRISRVTLSILGRSYSTTSSASFDYMTFDGAGSAPARFVSNVAPYRWYSVDATAAFRPGNGGALLRISPRGGTLIVSRVELCFDTR
jgi:hypothetical protein